MIDINSFDRASFSTAAPYEYVFSIADPFDRQLAYNTMLERAQYVGFKSFGKTYKEYEKKQKKGKNEQIGNTTAFEGQELELYCGDYICDDSGVYLASNGVSNVICMHPVMPIERLVNIDTGEEKLKIAYRSTYEWRTTIAPKEMIGSSSQIIKLWSRGICVTSKNAKDLGEYIAFMEIRNNHQLPSQSSVGRLGWIGSEQDKFSPYVDNIVFDGDDFCKRLFDSVKEQGDYNVWLDAVNEVRKNNKTSRIVLAAAFSSVILQHLNLHPYFCHIWGGAGLGKTLLLCLAASVFASPVKGDYITTFNSTVFGQEMTATFLNSLPMCIDELQIQSAAGINDFDKIIYTLAEGTGKTRGNKEGGIRAQSTWCNAFISTGERPITNSTSNGGAILRAIEIELTERVSDNGNKLAETLKQNYGFAGKIFVEALSDPLVMESVKAAQNKYFRDLQSKDISDKHSFSASALLAADGLAERLIFKDGLLLTVNDIIPYLVTNSDMDVNSKAIEYLYSVIAQHPNAFSGDPDSREVWGKDTGDLIYIIRSVFDKVLIEQGYNPQAVLAAAYRGGMIITDNDKKRMTKRTRIGSNLVRCVVLRKPSEDTDEYKEDDMRLW